MRIKLVSIALALFIITAAWLPEADAMKRRERKVRSKFSGKSALVLLVTLEKDEVKKGDSIQLNFILKNKGPEDVYINKRMHLNSKESLKKYRELFLDVVGPSGEALPCKVNTEKGYPKTDEFVLLAAGKEYPADRPRYIQRFFDFDKPGVYKIKATYHNMYGSEIGLKTFTGKIESIVLTLTVIE